jgi:hypothetical protein
MLIADKYKRKGQQWEGDARSLELCDADLALRQSRKALQVHPLILERSFCHHV